ncbi:MAG: TetR/AcrR family transcriptional regulator [Acidobacteriota bacterium]
MADDSKAETAKASWSEAMREARRERIIAAASEVFHDEGLDGASMRRIATAAGCTTGAIYPLFKSKEEIYAELLQRSLSELADRLVDAGAGLDRPAERVRARAFCILDFYRERPSDFTISFYLSAGLKRKGVGDELNQILNRQLAELNAIGLEDMAVCLGEDGVDERSVREASSCQDRAELAASALFAHITGLLVLELRGRFNVFAGDARTLLERYLDAIFPTTPWPTTSPR